MLDQLSEKHTSIQSVGIRPNSSILSVLSHLNYKAWFAVAEFVDNSIQSYNANKVKLRELYGDGFRLRVRIRLDAQTSVIEITDNAAGIRGDDFSRAFRAAEIPPDRSGLSEFGMGMKTAACWFTNTWSVRTKALDETVERTIHFSLAEIVNAKLDALPVTSEPAPAKQHYTVIRLENLGKKFPVARTQKKLRDHLTSIYRCYLRSGELEIYFDEDKEPIKFAEVEVMSAPDHNKPNSPPIKWSKDIDFAFDEARRVTGFVALRQEGSTSHAGFSLFRRGRLIMGSDDESYRPSEIFGNPNSYRYQRLFGELHVEGFEVSHTKDGFRWDDFEEEFLSRLKDRIREEPIDLLKQADNFRSRPSKEALQPVLTKASASLAGDFSQNAGQALSTKGAAEGIALAKIPLIPEPSLVATEKDFELIVGTQVWKICLRSSVDPTITEWVRIAKSSRPQLDQSPINALTVDVSVAHPFVQQFIGAKNENTEIFLRFAVAIALASESSNQAGYPTKLMVHWLNRILRECLPKESL